MPVCLSVCLSLSISLLHLASSLFFCLCLFFSVSLGLFLSLLSSLEETTKYMVKRGGNHWNPLLQPIKTMQFDYMQRQLKALSNRSGRTDAIPLVKINTNSPYPLSLSPFWAAAP